MRTKENYKLSKDFSLYEYLEGSSMPKSGIEMAWKNFNPEHENLIKKNIHKLQEIRDWVNEKYTSDVRAGTEIKMSIEAGFRPRDWELFRGRNGNSQHTICAIDFKVRNVSDIIAAKIHKAIYDKLHSEKYMSGLAIKDADKNSSGFVHLDFRTPTDEHIKRGFGARWKY